MKIKIITLFLFSVNFSYGQGLNLSPVDSSNFIFIADSLVNETSNSSSSYIEFKFNPDTLKYCACSFGVENLLVSFRTIDMLIRNNKCFSISKTGHSFQLMVGQQTEKRDHNGNPKWIFKSSIIDSSLAEEFINRIKVEISHSVIPRYKTRYEYPITYDSTFYVFGNYDPNKFGVTVNGKTTDRLTKLIRESVALIKDPD